MAVLGDGRSQVPVRVFITDVKLTWFMTRSCSRPTGFLDMVYQHSY